MGNFIKCSYNKLGDSYRSPWTNKFFPELKEPIYPPEIFREFEKSFNEIYSLYAKLYYGNNAVSSVFIWEQGESLDNGFNVAMLIDNSKSIIKKIFLLKILIIFIIHFFKKFKNSKGYSHLQ